MIDPTQPFGYTVSSLAKDPANKADAPFGKLISELAKEKNALKAGDSDINLSLTNGSATETSLKLLNKTVLEALNKELEADFGANAIQNAYDQGVDVSPQATADRIVQGATAFFASFSEKYSELDEPEQLEAFLETISAGIEKGFNEAKDILNSLNVLQGEIADNIDQTYSLVQQGLENFRLSFEQPNES